MRGCHNLSPRWNPRARSPALGQQGTQGACHPPSLTCPDQMRAPRSRLEAPLHPRGACRGRLATLGPPWKGPTVPLVVSSQRGWVRSHSPSGSTGEDKEAELRVARLSSRWDQAHPGVLPRPGLAAEAERKHRKTQKEHGAKEGKKKKKKLYCFSRQRRPQQAHALKTVPSPGRAWEVALPFGK